MVPEDHSSRGGPQAAGFRHTSGLRVGVLEVSAPGTQALPASHLSGASRPAASWRRSKRTMSLSAHRRRLPTRLPAHSAQGKGRGSSVTLLNDYVVLDSLGKGAYGSVKLCYSMQDDNLYALKVG